MFDCLGRLSHDPRRGAGPANFEARFGHPASVHIATQSLQLGGFVADVLTKPGSGGDSVYADDATVLLIYGYAFSNAASVGGSGAGMARFNARQLAARFAQNPAALTSGLKGAYTIIAYDNASATLHVYTDALNTRPLFFHSLGGDLYFSTSVTALTALHHEVPTGIGTPPPLQMDESAVLAYHLFDYLLLPQQTLVRHVWQAGPGAHYRFNGLGQTQTYTDVTARFALPPGGNRSLMSERDATEALEALMRRNLKDLYYAHPEDTFVAITGGYDSRLNLAQLCAILNKDELAQMRTFSYGREGSYDLSIAAEVAKVAGVKYESIMLNGKFEEQFCATADATLQLGNGTVEASRANYAFVYGQMGLRRGRILTGLFGSELIKPPTSLDSFLSVNTQALLDAPIPVDAARNLLDAARTQGLLPSHIIERGGEELLHQIEAHPLLNAKLPPNEKYWHFLMQVGVRKYFSKELQAERPYVENLHPFWDEDFIDLLVRTPYAWVHNFTTSKSFMKSLPAHRFYARMIARGKPELAKVMTTHGYEPRYVLNMLTLPLVTLQYRRYKSKIKAQRTHNIMAQMERYYANRSPKLPTGPGHLNAARLYENRARATKPFYKLFSLAVWMHRNGLTLT